MVEEMSPGLAAFWGVVAMSGVVLTQKPLTAFFRRQGDIAARFARRLVGFRPRPRVRRPQHGRRRHRHRHRRHHGRHRHAHRHRPRHGRDRRVPLPGQHRHHAGAGRRHLHHPGHRPADHGELRGGGDADGACRGGAGGRERSRRAADRRAHVRLLFRPDGRRLAAGGACRLCRRGHRRRRSDAGRLAGHLVRVPHGAAALHLHLQSRDPADRHRRCSGTSSSSSAAPSWP